MARTARVQSTAHDYRRILVPRAAPNAGYGILLYCSHRMIYTREKSSYNLSGQDNEQKIHSKYDNAEINVK